MPVAPFFIAEVSSNHARDQDRCRAFIQKAAEVGCDAVKFQLFRIDELFAPEILAKSEDHRRRKDWELPVSFLPALKSACVESGIQFSCTPFYLDAVGELEPYVDFYKIASYELPWDDLIAACARTGKPLVLSTGMATLEEIRHAVTVFRANGGKDLTLLHCVSGYPVKAEDCNLAAIKTIHDVTGVPVGWSDHSRDPAVVSRATSHWGAPMVEFHLDLEGEGAEYAAGHCWLPDEIAAVIADGRRGLLADGTGVKAPTPAEIDDRPWRADPSDGLRPTLAVRKQWQTK
ncbi:N-acetylneuraminate synthase family protein [Kordiimonas marina]|uniref:N-acetylneuraminate synthase family protein n=1 Tax=Kordiimonas marina TaxID=2872312 RepID=UPI001FF20C2A|nr:N-acetylneuraminate synthase family protein [Kordiimonas marina]MCJ9430317.1 N-acetylneuraminate synthase family protein [Kordiimonas marina]